MAPRNPTPLPNQPNQTTCQSPSDCNYPDCECPKEETTTKTNYLLIELTFDLNGWLVAKIPPNQFNKSGGYKTLTPGKVEEELKNLLQINEKIKRSEAFFYGEPTPSQWSRDLRRSLKQTEIQNKTSVLELDL